MKIEVRNIQIIDNASEETIAFTAKLFIKGKWVADVKNEGRGGATTYKAIDAIYQSIIREAEAYCKLMRPFKYDLTGTGIHEGGVPLKTIEAEPNLENYIDYIIFEFLRQIANT